MAECAFMCIHVHSCAFTYARSGKPTIVSYFQRLHGSQTVRANRSSGHRLARVAPLASTRMPRDRVSASNALQSELHWDLVRSHWPNVFAKLNLWKLGYVMLAAGELSCHTPVLPYTHTQAGFDALKWHLALLSSIKSSLTRGSGWAVRSVWE